MQELADKVDHLSALQEQLKLQSKLLVQVTDMQEQLEAKKKMDDVKLQSLQNDLKTLWG